MTKKIVIFLALIISVLSIMGLAIFGTGSEQTRTVPLVSVTIPSSEYDQEYTVDGKSEKYKNMTGIVSDTHPTHVIQYELDPPNATTEIKVSADPRTGVIDFVHNPDEQTVTLIYNPSVIGKTSGTVTITIYADQERRDTVTLMFGTPAEVDVDDDDIFGP